MHAYPEKLCLVQISIPGADVLVDPLAGFDLKPLWNALAGRELIFHAADYDLRLLKRVGFVPDRIFDTMLAARLLGLPRFGLADVVQGILGITLEKGPQKADWAKRPLTPRMEEYARNDTKHLKVVSDHLRNELMSKGRLAWHEEWCARWVTDCSVDSVVDPDEVWRIKGSSKLDRKGLAALRELWKWREEEAIASNRPPFFIVNHEVMVAMAQAVASEADVEALIPRYLTTRRRNGLDMAIKAAAQVPQSEWPEVLRHFSRRPSPREMDQADSLLKRRDKIAAELGLDPTLIFSKSVAYELAKEEVATRSRLMRWQEDLVYGATPVVSSQ